MSPVPSGIAKNSERPSPPILEISSDPKARRKRNACRSKRKRVRAFLDRRSGSRPRRVSSRDLPLVLLSRGRRSRDGHVSRRLGREQETHLPASDIHDLSHVTQAARLLVTETREELPRTVHVHMSGEGNYRGGNRGCNIRIACATVAGRRGFRKVDRPPRHMLSLRNRFGMCWSGAERGCNCRIHNSARGD